MPSPIGHALAGTVVALVADRTLGQQWPSAKRLAVCCTCAALAVLPDADLLYQPIHRTVTHSLVSIPLVTILASIVTGWVTGRVVVGFGVLCGLAWGSHIPLDWLGVDPNPPSGIQALWPFSDRWFISGVDLFPGTERRQIFTQAAVLKNLRAVLQELAIIGPVAVWLWWSRPVRDAGQA